MGVLLSISTYIMYSRRWIVCPKFHFLALCRIQGLRHTLLPRTFYCLGTLCIVIFCSKEQFASNWLVTVCILTHFAPQHTLPTGISFSMEHFTPQPPLLPRTLFSSAQFASQHPLLLVTLCSSAQFAAQHTLLLSTLCFSVHFTP